MDTTFKLMILNAYSNDYRQVVKLLGTELHYNNFKNCSMEISKEIYFPNSIIFIYHMSAIKQIMVRYADIIIIFKYIIEKSESYDFFYEYIIKGISISLKNCSKYV